MITYNTDNILSTATAIKNDATALQAASNNFWSSYQGSMHGTLPALNASLSSFQALCQTPFNSLIQNRSVLGEKLGMAVVMILQNENQLSTGFTPRPVGREQPK